MPEPISSLGLEATHLVAGAAGGVVRAVLRPGQSLVQTIGTTTVGVLCAAYLTPLAERWLDLADADVAVSNGVAFGIGLVGMSLAEGAITLFHAWSRKPRLPGPAGDLVNPPQDGGPTP